MGRLNHGSVHLVMAVLCFASACLSAQSSPGRQTCPLPADDSQLSGVPGTVASSSCFAALQQCCWGPRAAVFIWQHCSAASSLLQGSVHREWSFARGKGGDGAATICSRSNKELCSDLVIFSLLIRKKSQGIGTYLIDAAFGDSGLRTEQGSIRVHQHSPSPLVPPYQSHGCQ